jgi:glycosyltransferase involved in cell wall biosynthesis
MRVLHVVPSYLPARRYGGPVFATHALCAALARNGLDVTVFTTNVDGAGESDVPIGIPVLKDGVNVRYFRSSILRRLYFSPGMAHALEAECDSFDLMHLHSVYLWPTAMAARMARRRNVPYLISPRGMLVKELIVRKSTWLKSAWISLIERRNLECAAGIHVTSSAEARELRRFGFALPAIYEVPNGVAAESEPDEVDTLPEKTVELLARGRPVVLFLGRINWKKGLDRLIAAMSQLPEADLLIAGNDEEQYTAELMALAAQKGVQNQVFFLGPVYGLAKKELYRRATLFALPSYSENFGNTVLEAMVEGCPVVVTPEVGARSIVEESGGGLVTIGEPALLGDAIRRLIVDTALRADMSRRGKEMMKAKYSWSAVAESMCDAYLQTVRNR